MIRSIIRGTVLGLLVTAFFAAPALAQSGFGLKAHLVYNSSTAQTFQDERDTAAAEDFAGFSVGAEYVLPFGLGLGVSGYSSGDPRDTDAGTVFILLGEANYFLNLPVVPISPYAGVHFGLGTFTWEGRDEIFGDRGDLDRANLGWQVGVRVQLLRGLALDAQYRRLSASAEDAQTPGFEADQVLLGVRLF